MLALLVAGYIALSPVTSERPPKSNETIADINSYDPAPDDFLSDDSASEDFPSEPQPDESGDIDVDDFNPAPVQLEPDYMPDDIAATHHPDYLPWILGAAAAVAVLLLWSVSRRKVRVKLVAKADCAVEIDNKPLSELSAGKVSTVKLGKGEYYLEFIPRHDDIATAAMPVKITHAGQLIMSDFPAAKDHRRKAIKCFIAGSTRLEAERDALRAGIAQVHNAWSGKDFEILSYTYEDFQRQAVEGGHQKLYDDSRIHPQRRNRRIHRH